MKFAKKFSDINIKKINKVFSDLETKYNLVHVQQPTK